MEKEVIFNIINPGMEYNENDIRFQEMMFMINNSGVPLNRLNSKLYPEKCDIASYSELREIQKDIVNFVDGGSNVYIFSKNCGNGKTTWGIKLLLQYFNEVWACNSFTERGMIINVPLFLSEIKNDISKKDKKTLEIKEKLQNLDLIVWDYIGSTDLSSFDYTQILTYLDYRSFNLKSNIFTGNTSPSDLSKFLGDRIASRVLYGAKVIEFLGEDRRY